MHHTGVANLERFLILEGPNLGIDRIIVGSHWGPQA